MLGRVGKDQDGVVGHIVKHDNRLLLRLAESCCEEYAATTGGAKVSVTNNNTATASAQATGMVITTEKIQDMQERAKRKLQHQVQQARLRLEAAYNRQAEKQRTQE